MLTLQEHATIPAYDRDTDEYYYAVGAVNEFKETLSAPSNVVVVALIPSLPPLAGFVIVISAAGVVGVNFMRNIYTQPRARKVLSQSRNRNTISGLPESNA